MAFGMKFVGEGKTLSDNDLSQVAYTSENDTLQVDITQNPTHIDIIDPLKGASTWALNQYEYKEEILFEIPHNLPFKPDYTCYFYLADSPDPSEIGAYRLDYIRIGVGGEYIAADTTETHFRIIHSAKYTPSGSSPPATLTVDGGSLRSFRVKYMIHPMPDLGTLTYYP